MQSEKAPLFRKILDWIGREDRPRAPAPLDLPARDLMRAFRVLGVAASVLFPLFGIAYRKLVPGAVEPMGERYVYAAACLIVVGMSFVPSWSRATIWAINLIFFASGPWIISVAFRNGFALPYALSVMLVIGIASLGFSRRLHLAAFLAVCFLCTMAGVTVAGVLQTEKFFIVGVVGILCFFSYLLGASRLKVQERVGELEDLRRVLIDQSTDALVIIDPITRLAVEWNSRAQSMFNLTRGEAPPGLPAAVFGSAEWGPVDAVLILRDVAERGVHQREKLYLVEDARAFWGELSVTSLRMGRRGLLLARVADVTARRRMEGKLGLAEQEQRFFAEQSADMLVRMTPVGYCLEVSSASKALLGAEPGDVAGRSLYEFVHPEDAGSLRRWAESPAAGKSFRQRCRMRRADGSAVWADFLARKVSDPGTEELREVVAVIRDASESKELEEGLESGS
jgi:PAS domain S-box-containing protein